jgi:hypothetical protein
VCFEAVKNLANYFCSELDSSVAWNLAEKCHQEGFNPDTEEELAAAIEEIEGRSEQENVTLSVPENQHRFHGAWMCFWTAFGEILGSFRDTDDEARAVDYALPAPRGHVLLPGASIDKVRHVIRTCEAELNKAADVPSFAERIVVWLVQGIEPLARRIWKKEFDRKRRDRRTNRDREPGLKEVLRDVEDYFPAATEEHRFAAVSLALYNTYRCIPSHDLDSFSCSLEEARFVLASLRMLMHLSEKLGPKHNPDFFQE